MRIVEILMDEVKRFPARGGRRLVLLALAGLAMAGCSRQGDSGGAKPQATYDATTGRLSKLVFDANKNGRNDSVSYMDGTTILRIELDLDENGTIDRWDFYKPDHTIEKVGFSRQNDGVMDAVTFYNGDRTINHIEISSKRDGRFDKTEFYDGNVLVRSEEDTDGDGRPDKWDTWAPLPGHQANEPAYSVTSSSFDDEGRGFPQRRFTFGPGGTVARVDVDPDGDGVFEPLGKGGVGRSKRTQ
jgi:hypothetical protein